MDYIPIDSVKDIDTRKISIRDINKRYMDRDGNRYATRFNMQKKKIEIVRLARNKNEANKLRGAILRGKKERFDSSKKAKSILSNTQPNQNINNIVSKPTPQEPSKTQDEEFEYDEADLDLSDDFNMTDSGNSILDDELDEVPDINTTNLLEKPFLEEIGKEIERLKERQAIIINQLKDIQGNLIDNQTLSELNREIDLQCWQAGEESVNFFKELYGYPRSINQYLIKMEATQKQQIEKLKSDDQKMNYIRRIESARTFTKALNSYLSKSEELNSLLENIPLQQKESLDTQKSKALETIETSIAILIANTNTKLAEIQVWEKKYTKIIITD